MSETEVKDKQEDGGVAITSTSRNRSDSEGNLPSSPEIHFEPIVQLPLMETKTMEENEDELVKIRGKLYRYDTNENPPEWKERGVGDVKILKHKETGAIRIVMRRDKTLKLCANHYIKPSMEMKKHCNSDKAFVWSTVADFSDEKPAPETLAIRFGNPENATKFKNAFDDAKKLLVDDKTDNIADQLGNVKLNDSTNNGDGGNDESRSDPDESESDDSEDDKPEADQHCNPNEKLPESESPKPKE